MVTADETYDYDTIGNRTSAILVPAIHSRVQDDGIFTYTYDNEGNLATKTRKSAAIAADHSTQYTWDHRNRLKSATQTSNDPAPVVVTSTYFYDAFDHRVNQTVVDGGVTTVTQYAYQGDQLLLARNTGGAVTDRFLPGPGGRVIAQDAAMATVIGGMTVPAGPRWLLADHEGSVRTVMSATGAVLGRVNYDSFGKVTSATTPAAAGSLFGYAGSVYDVASRLSYMNARYYDPSSGRFLSEDLLGFAAGDMNVYRYVGKVGDRVREDGPLFELPRQTAAPIARRGRRGKVGCKLGEANCLASVLPNARSQVAICKLRLAHTANRNQATLDSCSRARRLRFTHEVDVRAIPKLLDLRQSSAR